MDLGRQWNERIKIWNDFLPKLFFTECGTCEASFFTTMEHLPYEKAAKQKFTPAPEGLAWGKKWEYGWFKFSLIIPPVISNRLPDNSKKIDGDRKSVV